MRTFIAIDIPESLKKNAGAQVSPLYSGSRGAVRWTAWENLHITLKFLGEIPPSRLNDLQEAIRAGCAAIPPFVINLSGLGFFPNARNPRVIWAGIQAPKQLANVFEGIERSARAAGFSAETKPFSPHLTLGRVRDQASASELEWLKENIKNTSGSEFGRFTVHEIVGFKSDLRPSGPIYSRLFSVPLKEV